MKLYEGVNYLIFNIMLQILLLVKISIFKYIINFFVKQQV